jgi:hypothetical protein
MRQLVHLSHAFESSEFVTLIRLAKSKRHDIYCDTEFNTSTTVYLNIYQNFVLSAMKMHRYLRCWGIDVSKNVAFIHSMSPCAHIDDVAECSIGTVQQMIQSTFAAIRTRYKKDRDQNRDVQKISVIW